MNRWLINSFAWMTIILFSYGCVSTQPIIAVEELSIDKRAKIIWQNNDKTSTHHIIVQGDSIYAWEYATSSELISHIAEVQSIVVNDRGKGAIRGIRRGAMIGAAFGFGIFAAFSGELFYYATEGILWGGSMGVLPGLFSGIILGSKTRYIFQPAITSAPSLAENTNTGVENRPIPQTIHTDGGAPNNPEQKPKSEIDLVRARVPIYLGPDFQVGPFFSLAKRAVYLRPIAV